MSERESNRISDHVASLCKADCIESEKAAVATADTLSSSPAAENVVDEIGEEEIVDLFDQIEAEHADILRALADL